MRQLKKCRNESGSFCIKADELLFGAAVQIAESKAQSVTDITPREMEKNDMRIPAKLKRGDTIGLVAPSFGAATEPYITRLAAAIRKFEARGYKVVAADSVYKSDGLGISTDPAAAAKDVMDFYLDDRIDALFSVGGGELMNETISHIDFARLGEGRPKWYLGYSDNTNFLMPMASIGGVAGIYGPCATSFGKPWGETEEDTFRLLEGRSDSVLGYAKFELPFEEEGEEKDPLAPLNLTEPKILTSFLPEGGRLVRVGEEEEIHFSGMLLGGCLDILTNLSGTGFDGVPSLIAGDRPVIWVLEACDLNPMSIRRAVWTLLQRGWLRTASGFLVGRPLASFRGEMMGVDSYNAVTDLLAGAGVPVIMDCDIGHVPPMMPLVIGSEASVSVKGNDLTVRMNLDT